MTVMTDFLMSLAVKCLLCFNFTKSLVIWVMEMMFEIFQSMSYILFLDVKCQISLNFITRLWIFCPDVNFNFTFQFFIWLGILPNCFKNICQSFCTASPNPSSLCSSWANFLKSLSSPSTIPSLSLLLSLDFPWRALQFLFTSDSSDTLALSSSHCTNGIDDWPLLTGLWWKLTLGLLWENISSEWSNFYEEETSW